VKVAGAQKNEEKKFVCICDTLTRYCKRLGTVVTDVYMCTVTWAIKGLGVRRSLQYWQVQTIVNPAPRVPNPSDGSSIVTSKGVL